MSDTPELSAAAEYDFDAVVNEISKDANRKEITFRKGGETFRIPAPLDWPDEILELQAEAGNNPAGTNPVRLARAYLEAGGEGQWERYVAVGGTAMRFMKFFEHAVDNAGESSAS